MRIEQSQWAIVVNVFFRLVVVSCSIFIITILALVASLLGDPRAPVSQWLNANAGELLTYEVVITLLLGLIAMTVDRRQTLAAAAENPSSPQDTNSADANDPPAEETQA